MKYKIIRPPLTPRFHLPKKDDFFRISSGDHVKLMFQVGNDIVERMWVQVQKCYDDYEWTGKLDNEPFGKINSRVLKLGKRIKFHPYDVIDIIFQGTPEMVALEELLSKKKKQTLEQQGWFEKITNNQTFAVIIGGLILTIVVYCIYKYSGVNLVQLK